MAETNRSFVHLHCHSHYSLLDGANRIPELVKHTKNLGMNALALTDHGNLYGAIEFYREASAVGLNPIIGYEAYVAPRKRTDRESGRRREAGFHLTLLAQNVIGFKNLIKMASIAFTEGFYFIPRIDKELLEAHKEGIICLSGCASSEFSDFILKEQWKEAEELASWFAKVFGEKNFFVEIQNNGIDIQKQCGEGAIRIANKLGLPLVATCDAHYLTREDAFAHEVLLCINTGKKLSDEKRMSYGSDQFHIQAPDEVYKRFPEHADAVARSQEIANSCDIKLDFKKRHFPVFVPPEEKSVETYLRELAYKGLHERYGKNPSPEAVARLEHELGIVIRMGFASYFLIVWDFVRFADEHGIPASARGSGCGAILCYVLRLSHVDPLEYDLLFERFLDPNRSEAPDIDIDFCQDRREDVIRYVKQKYGEESVAQIATFGTLAARAAIKDVGRVLDIPLPRVSQITNLIPEKPLGITIEESLQASPDLKNEYDSDPEVKRWLDIAIKLEGMNRNAGTHAAGVVIANGPINNFVPVHRVVRKQAGENGPSEAIIATQWVMGDIEKVGMLKMDFLGLRTLTVLDNAVRLIKKTRGETLDIYRLPLNDKQTYELLQRGDAKGVFQFESQGIRDLLRRLKPDNIRDIVACTALYRPGPLDGGMVDAYVNRKHGREKPEYLHPVMEEVLKETYGIMVYQEQVMRILNRLGAIELSSAYACIKAISKKKQEIIDARKIDFIKGAQAKGLSAQQAEDIFDLIVKFGGYGFNKSHSAAYAHVSYQTAYLKTHYTAEFMAALLSSEIDDSNKRSILVEHIHDARKLNIEVLPPDVNTCEVDFTVRDNKILFGLTAIKGLGRNAAAAIVEAREARGPFADIYDFCERVDAKAVSRAAMERLVKAGAFDCFGHRAQVMAALPKAVQSAAALQQDRRSGQINMFEVVEDSPEVEARREPLPNVPRWTNTEQLQYEKEALDFYLSSHPLAEFDADLRRYARNSVEDLQKLDDGTELRLGGMLSQVRVFMSKTGKPYVRCKIADMTGEAESVMWPSDYVRFKDLFKDDAVVFADGKVERREQGEPQFVMNKIATLDTARKEWTKSMLIRMNTIDHSESTIDAVSRILKRTPGPCQVYLEICDAAGKRAMFRLGDGLRVHPANVNTEELQTILGLGCIVFSGR